MSTITKGKNCWCYTCKKAFHYLGIARHRVMHKEKGQNCEKIGRASCRERV